MTPLFVELEDAVQLHRLQLQQYGGGDGIRDLGALQSALAMPQAGMGDEYFHKGLHEMAAAYLFHLCQNHPFVDGNKRVALASAVFFLESNGLEVTANSAEAFDLTIRTASGKADKAAIAAFLKKHSRKLKH